MIRNDSRRVAIFIGLMIQIVFVQSSSASVVDPREIQVATESSLIDLDSAVLGMYFHPGLGEALTYESTIDRFGWNGHLFGNYGTNAIDVRYAGVLTPLDTEGQDYRIDYTSVWNINGIPAYGSGWGTSQDPVTGVTITINDAQVAGSISYNSGLASIKLSAKKDYQNKVFTSAGTLGVITIPIADISLLDGTLGFAYLQSTGNYASAFRANYLFGLIQGSTRIVNEGVIKTPVSPPPTEESGFVVPSKCSDGVWCNPDRGIPVLSGNNSGQTIVASVPEPANWALVIAGISVIGALIRQRKMAYSML